MKKSKLLIKKKYICNLKLKKKDLKFIKKLYLNNLIII